MFLCATGIDWAGVRMLSQPGDTSTNKEARMQDLYIAF